MKIRRGDGMPFASPTYFERNGKPKDIAELKCRRLVLQDAEQVDSLGFARLFPGVSQAGAVSIRTNASTTHSWAIVGGAGTRVLPPAPRLIEPVDIGYRSQWDIWSVYHPDLANIPRIRLITDWLIELFSPKQHPCFSDEFIHPRDLPGKAGGLSLFGL